MSLPSKSRATALRRAAELIQLDRLTEARALLKEIAASDPDNLTAWEYMAQAACSREEEIYCLKRILRLDPEHLWAKRKLDQLRARARPPGEPDPTGQGPIEPGEGTRNTHAMASPSSALPIESTEPRERRKRSRSVLYLAALLILLCIGAWGYLLLRAGYLPATALQRSTQTAGALSYENCREVIVRAMQAAGIYCEQVGPNKVCYGNITLQAELVPGSQDPFSQRGDIIDVFKLLHLSAAPMNSTTNEWGVAIFKLLANLPRSIPGQMVTLVVFGSTRLENPAQDLQTFYFSSQLGQVTCEQVPLDGILISMPEGAGISLNINGAEVTLMGNASLHASPNQSLQVNLYSGMGLVAAGGVEEVFGAGQSVSVPLGGPNGTEAVGPPSAPQSLPEGEVELSCLMTGQVCEPGEIQPVSQEEVMTAVASLLYRSPTPTSTPIPTTTPTATPTRTRTLRLPSHTPNPTSPPPNTFTPTPNTTLAVPLSPLVDCVFDDGSGTYLAYFGYESLNAGTVAVPVGSDNQIPPAPDDRGQPTEFPVGLFHNVFNASFTSGDVVWTLTGHTATAGLGSPHCPGSATATTVPTPICAALSIGPLDTPNSTDLEGVIYNVGVDTVTIDTLEIYWINDPFPQQLQQVSLDGSLLWSGIDNVPTSLFPTEYDWNGPSSRQIAGGANATLLADFHDAIQTDGERPRFEIHFSNGCTLVRVYIP